MLFLCTWLFERSSRLCTCTFLYLRVLLLPLGCPCVPANYKTRLCTCAFVVAACMPLCVCQLQGPPLHLRVCCCRLLLPLACPCVSANYQTRLCTCAFLHFCLCTCAFCSLRVFVVVVGCHAPSLSIESTSPAFVLARFCCCFHAPVCTEHKTHLCTCAFCCCSCWHGPVCRAQGPAFCTCAFLFLLLFLFV